MTENKKQAWEAYCTEQLSVVAPLLLNEGFLLEEDQPHIIGERYILSGPKLVLYGIRQSDDVRVVIKITNNTTLAQEMLHEQNVRDVLNSINFAYKTFLSPEVILSGEKGPYTFYITRYVPQEKKFLEHTLEEQFFLALKAFEAQEGSHATTSKHKKLVQGIFDIFDAERYLDLAKKRLAMVTPFLTENPRTQATLAQSLETLEGGRELIDRYCDFLTHWDFVPHNIRINERNIYLLDHTAIRFGNKYDGWARFMNFMTLYNPKLENMLETYVRENRFPGEYEALRLMRLYRLIELISFYVEKRSQAEGNLTELSDARITFWSHVAEAVLARVPVDSNIRTTYEKKRDALRDDEEKERQKALH